MLAIISANLLKSEKAQPKETPFEIRDTRLSGFLLRVQPSGSRSYIAEWGRGKRKTIGKVGHLTPDEARARCEKMLGNVAHGRQVSHGIDGADAFTLGEFLTGTYERWYRVNRPRTADKNLSRLRSVFAKWLPLPFTDITVERIEAWKTDRLESGLAPGTVLKDAMALSGLLTRALRLGKIQSNPMRSVDKPSIDRTPKVRYLDSKEEKRLREALTERDAEMRAARKSANEWRRARKQDRLPDLPHFGDHLTPAVLVSMNTGLRRGELLTLRWDNVDFKQKSLTIEGKLAKSKQTRHIPLNSDVIDVLKKWRAQSSDAERVFPFETSFKKSWASLLTRAGIERFRWHDLRHHFASRLAQAGVPLNTIRELLGHGNMAMTIRYAHLAPDQKREAVAKLVQS